MKAPADIVKEAQKAHGYGYEELVGVFPLSLRAIIENEAWQDRSKKDGASFSSFYDFAVYPIWRGLGLDGGTEQTPGLTYEDAIRYCEVKHRDVAGMLRSEMPAAKKVGRPPGDKVDNVNIREATGAGNSASYLARRLKRDAPEIAEKLAAGAFPSVRAAAIAAGIVKVPTPLEAAKKAVAKLDPDDLSALMAWLEERAASTDADSGWIDT